jgi:hypothetical protein
VISTTAERAPSYRDTVGAFVATGVTEVKVGERRQLGRTGEQTGPHREAVVQPQIGHHERAR